MAKAARNTTKTNAARLLEHAGISFELIPYTVDESNLAADHVYSRLSCLKEQAVPDISYALFRATARWI